MSDHETTFILAGGCYTCLDGAFRTLRGVNDVEVGFTGGVEQPVNAPGEALKNSGHAEAIRVTFDPRQIPAAVILDVFFTMHDPTTVDRQGEDVGHHYRSAMYFTDQTQRELFEAAIERARDLWPDQIVTEMAPARTFYAAPADKQDFFGKNPEDSYCQIKVQPKVVEARRAFSEYSREAIAG